MDDGSPSNYGTYNGEKRDRDSGRSKSSRHRSRSREREERGKSRKDRSRSRERRDKDKGRDKDRERHKDKERERRASKDRSRSKSHGGRDRSRERKEKDRRHYDRPKEYEKDYDRDRVRERDHRGDIHRPRERFPPHPREKDFRRRSRSKDKSFPTTYRRRSRSPRPFRRGRTPPNGVRYPFRDASPPEELSAEERDARTVFCMQLSQRIRARDLEEFFSSVGKVRDVRLITCNKTRRFKGIAYIEFKDPESVALALGLSGQRLLGIPISVQHTQAEKNRLANSPPAPPPKVTSGPMRLYVGSLHFNITEDMLRGIFEPFGKIDLIQLIMDSDTGRSKGYGFITFHNADDAKKALEQLNGFELAGRPMKVGNVTERLDVTTHASLDTDEMDRSGIDLGATGRLQLMFKLAEGAGLAVPRAAADALLATAPQPAPQQPVQQSPPIATQCFLLTNMFDPATETNPNWDSEIQDDVVEECNKHGGVMHVYVDKQSPGGNVYVKCTSIATAVLAVNALHGRWFAGRVITAAYVPLINYHTLFPDSAQSTALLKIKRAN
ncbi:RNA-binding protein 39 isoform X3 [Topomyia yanbarensis]|uniref:RNA-binding protein 39 isoform X3 n=1 Tax=Topomyia yanbarensis TaxID=2498891 RepID=UPI00273AA9B9|nr:RNA-binding protein 39 isoform X3 [Topomyia yanbarensis]XP_058819941.1 RNA-binding protein 39 isoform X3 [Topomyia yanbarensis]XP_058819942.1 RNA-binding protein 39 isoform X3 [Topomyia yanbarensis]XP_058819943.1 RNA-binding protein 39 isoform X3 [Topomyia yanbarensis]XP_058819944.1 RNA-binding protein 39 isoform X3 [Topomyia yanbarensis]XP_058819945.1 RNA-binding protein 39 isoform X3 [Topomyia yanbarensis]XP_058819946.1 RNA-binding protein 39 isoform X3 [Topomyia yanbarensis]XP_05881994